MSIKNTVLGALAAAAVAGASAPSDAALIFNLSTAAGDPAAMKVTVDQGAGADADKLMFKVDFVPSGGNTIGDLRGIFFDVANESLIAGLSLIGSDVLLCKGNDNLDSCGSSSNNVNGTGHTYDLGVEIGSQGIGAGDDFQTISFKLDHSSQNLVLGTFFDLVDDPNSPMAGRVMSLGTPNSREGSAKLLGDNCTVDCEPSQVPEPVSLALLGAGLFGLGFARRRSRA